MPVVHSLFTKSLEFRTSLPKTLIITSKLLYDNWSQSEEKLEQKMFLVHMPMNTCGERLCYLMDIQASQWMSNMRIPIKQENRQNKWKKTKEWEVQRNLLLCIFLEFFPNIWLRRNRNEIFHFTLARASWNQQKQEKNKK